MRTVMGRDKLVPSHGSGDPQCVQRDPRLSEPISCATTKRVGKRAIGANSRHIKQMKMHKVPALGLIAGFAAVIVAAESSAGADKELFSGKAAMGDWTTDKPGVRRKVGVAD